MATTDDLVALGFTSSSVAVVTLNLPHPDPFGMGPFCRLRVQTTAPQKPGVYAWVADGQVRYVGKAVEDFGLVQKVKGQSLGRAYDDYTYCPPSKALKKSQTRAHVNGLLNGSLAAGHVVEWWWLVAARPGEVEELLIQRWDPPLEHPLAQAAMRVFELVVRIDSPDLRWFDEPRRGAVCGLIGRNTAWLAKSVGIRRGGAPCTRHTSPHRDSGC